MTDRVVVCRPAGPSYHLGYEALRLYALSFSAYSAGDGDAGRRFGVAAFALVREPRVVVCRGGRRG